MGINNRHDDQVLLARLRSKLLASGSCGTDVSSAMAVLAQLKKQMAAEATFVSADPSTGGAAAAADMRAQVGGR